MMNDNWGCEADLFPVSSFGSQTLSELVEGLNSRKPTGGDAMSFASSGAHDVQVVPCIIRKKPRFAPKILKKKSTSNKTSNEANLKHVTFEVSAVEQLLAREGNVQDRNVARERLVMSLGGSAPKGKSVNYKLLKEHRKQQKAEDEKKVAGIKQCCK
ncbi:hypothetical protein NECAME_02487 [Necator americanus]|uniref:Uncharacterized protein n=1 Tax=Necator americanus TaxID=51031 RepID=W2TDU9_NECAM|nr:hypothetical protein NECAME_02487 [Necator americanus]ETN80008.1 hypothetical protein NECAME_02487 [Necator americanus]